MADIVGRTIGNYRITELLGRGGMAVVYKAYQISLDRYVAVKILPDLFAQDETLYQRFEQEAKAAARLRHPNIAEVFDFGRVEDQVYLVMEFVAGGTLRDRLSEPLPTTDGLRIIRQVADALSYAHRHGIIHRDVKPSNILLTPEGDAVLADFGIASLPEGAIGKSGTGMAVGTAEYMAPEQAQGLPVDGRTDIYSLGVVLYEMTTGRVPYEAETPVAVALKSLNDPLPLPRTVNPDIAEAVEKIILTCMAKDPANRYPNAAALVDALDAVLATGGDTSVLPAASVAEVVDEPKSIGPTPARPAPSRSPTPAPAIAPAVASASAPAPSPAAASAHAPAPLSEASPASSSALVSSATGARAHPPAASRADAPTDPSFAVARPPAASRADAPTDPGFVVARPPARTVLDPTASKDQKTPTVRGQTRILVGGLAVVVIFAVVGFLALVASGARGRASAPPTNTGGSTSATTLTAVSTPSAAAAVSSSAQSTPTQTQVAKSAAVESTSTPVLPTATPSAIPPTATPSALPPTATPSALPPTATPSALPPTATPSAVPPTATPTAVRPTATPSAVPPTATSTAAGGVAAPVTPAAASFRGRLVYANFRGPDKFGDFDIMILDVPGGTPRLTAQYASDPVFSPDGTRILYFSWTEAGFYSMGLDGKSQSMVSTSADDAYPAWSPDGKRVAFDNKGDIWIMNADGSGRTKVISGGQEPDWSPDGKQLVLKGCIASTCGLIIADADGKNQRQLTSDATDESPTWDPAGNLILFTSQRSGRGDVWVVRPDGSSPQNLTSGSAGGPAGNRNSGAATWSRDGKSILFRSDRDVSWGIYVMNRDGSGQSRLVSSNVADEWSQARVVVAK